MIRPLTCLCLLAAAGSGLYLYQEKHRAQLLDREIGRVVHQADATRERIGLLRAEWALLNEPDRLSGLAAQHLSLQPLAPTQFAQVSDLPNRLPAPVLTPPPAPVDEPAAAPAVPTAAVTPPARLQMAANALPAHPALPAPASTATPPAATAMAKPVATPPVVPVQLAAAHTVVRKPTAPKPEVEHAVAERTLPEPGPRLAALPKPEPEAPRVAPLRPVYAPIIPAYQPGQPPLAHSPTVQAAAATTSTYAASAYAPNSYAGNAPFVGSALGMAHTTLAAPVPMAASLGR